MDTRQNRLVARRKVGINRLNVSLQIVEGVITKRVLPPHVLAVKFGQVRRNQGEGKAFVVALRNIPLDFLLFAVRFPRITLRR